MQSLILILLKKVLTSEQEIFDTIVEVSKRKYLAQCTNVVTEKIRGIEQMKKVCLGMYHYQTSDEWLGMFRRMLIIEQFRNPQMAEIYKEFFIDIPMQRQRGIFEELIKYGFMKDKDAKVMAMELYAPFFMYHTVKENEVELQHMFKKHAENFFDTYVIKADHSER